MAGRGRTSFQKRQKEQLRLERRQQKAARKQERKAHGPESDLGEAVTSELEMENLDVRVELNPAGGIIFTTEEESESSEQQR
ncbi:MAG: hypothetical protein ACM336_07865 [Acidobacteriota bacterium]